MSIPASDTSNSRRKDYLEVYQEVTSLISSVHDPQQVMNLVVERLPKLLQVDGATVRLLDKKKHFILGAASGLSQEYLSRPIIDTEEVMNALKAGKPTAMHLMEDDSRHKAQKKEGVTGTMSLPILHKNEVIGILRLLTKHQRSFSEEELDFAMSLAKQIGLAIVNARMFNQIQEHDRFLQTVLDSLWLQILVISQEHIVVLVNRNFLATCNLQEDQVLGKRYSDVVPWHAEDEKNCPLNTVFSQKQAIAILDQLSSNGKKLWFQRHLTPVLNENGEVEFVIEAMRDITDQRLLEQEKMKRVKLEGIVQMAGTAAHELNSPLFAALGTAELIHEDLTESGLNQEVMKDMERIIGNLREIGNLTRKMAKVTDFEEKDYVGGTKIVELHSKEES